MRTMVKAQKVEQTAISLIAATAEGTVDIGQAVKQNWREVLDYLRQTLWPDDWREAIPSYFPDYKNLRDRVERLDDDYHSLESDYRDLEEDRDRLELEARQLRARIAELASTK